MSKALMPKAPLSKVSAHQGGFALVTAMIVVVVLTAMLSTYFVLTRSELTATKASADEIAAFYAAEGGLNMRAEQVRQKFLGYERPLGTSPSLGTQPCVSGNKGGGDFACQTFSLDSKNVVSYVTEPNPAGQNGVVSDGIYVGLNYLQYAYQVHADALNAVNADREATLSMEFQSRLVPLFQFAAFYKDDLEILPGKTMNLNGRIHTNGNLYLGISAPLTINGRISAAGDIYRGRKDDGTCGGTVNVADTDTTTLSMQDCSSTSLVTAPNIVKYNGRVQAHVPPLTVPSITALDPSTRGDNELWTKADVRIVAVGNPTIGFTLQVRNKDNTLDTGATFALNSNPNCKPIGSPPAVSTSSTFYDKREKKDMSLIEVDQKRLMQCIEGTNAFKNANGDPLKLDDTTGNGLVLHFSFDDGDPATNNAAAAAAKPYGVRIRNADTLGTGNSTSTPIKGLTIVTNQAAYVQGDFNKNSKKPASIMADSINILSNAWTDPIAANKTSVPVATNTVVNAAFLSGTDTTTGGQYGGGLENYPRFHENWDGKTFTYRGSLVSLGQPAHAKGKWGPVGVYSIPNRNWDYDSDFNDASKLPPLAPRFVLLRQLLFARDY